MDTLAIRRGFGLFLGILATMVSGVNLAFTAFAPNLKDQFQLSQTARKFWGLILGLRVVSERRRYSLAGRKPRFNPALHCSFEQE